LKVKGKVKGKGRGRGKVNNPTLRRKDGGRVGHPRAEVSKFQGFKVSEVKRRSNGKGKSEGESKVNCPTLRRKDGGRVGHPQGLLRVCYYFGHGDDC
jgi:hypothetical protein